jgi:hypothetical protein
MSDSSQVRVVVRIRPLLPHELSNPAIKRATAAAGGSLPVQATRTAEGAPAVLLREEPAESVSLRGAAGGNTEGSSSGGGPVETLYAFDGVYEPEGPGSSNAALFDAEVGPHLASRLFAGSSVTLFAYGMTGTGKSHSMAGTAADPGLIPRSLRTLFDAVADRVACGEQDWDTTNITFSFFELYNEKIYVCAHICETATCWSKMRAVVHPVCCWLSLLIHMSLLCCIPLILLLLRIC